MDLLIVVSTDTASPIFSRLAQACSRAHCQWSVFFTHSGASIAAQPATADLVASASQAVVCHDSWTRFVTQGLPIPAGIESGSQTNHSEMAGKAGRIVSL